MKITKIEAQIKTRGRYSIFVDDKFTFSLSESALIESGLRVGQELSAQDVEAYKDESAVDKLYNRSLSLIARRPRSEWEIREYLKRKSNDPSHIEKILNKLSMRGYINDEDFARRWVESRRMLKPISKKKLQLELRQKRISDTIITQVLSDDQTEEIEVLKELIEKKRAQTRYKDDLKLMQYLTRQGFSYDLVKQALRSEES